MHRLPIPSLSRRALFGVLALWLCVLVTGVVAPWTHAQQMAGSVERLCSGHDGAVQWVLSPTADATAQEAQALHHLLDCPMCMPVLVSGAPAHVLPLAVLTEEKAIGHVHALIWLNAAHWPPARGPPLSI